MSRNHRGFFRFKLTRPTTGLRGREGKKIAPETSRVPFERYNVYLSDLVKIEIFPRALFAGLPILWVKKRPNYE